MQENAILQALKCLKITHHSPGRLRLDASAKLREIPDLPQSALEKLFTAPGVKECKINRLLGKITLLYEPAIISGAALEQLLRASTREELFAALSLLGIDGEILREICPNCYAKSTDKASAND